MEHPSTPPISPPQLYFFGQQPPDNPPTPDITRKRRKPETEETKEKTRDKVAELFCTLGLITSSHTLLPDEEQDNEERMKNNEERMKTQAVLLQGYQELREKMSRLEGAHKRDRKVHNRRKFLAAISPEMVIEVDESNLHARLKEFDILCKKCVPYDIYDDYAPNRTNTHLEILKRYYQTLYEYAWKKTNDFFVLSRILSALQRTEPLIWDMVSCDMIIDSFVFPSDLSKTNREDPKLWKDRLSKFPLNQFKDASHLSAWAGLCPGNYESAGKKKSSRIRKGNRNLKVTMTQAAWAASRTKNTYLGAKYRALIPRKGKKRAIITIGHKMLIICYHILKDRVPFNELGVDFLDKLEPERKAKYHEKRLEELGYHVELTKKIA